MKTNIFFVDFKSAFDNRPQNSMEEVSLERIQRTNNKYIKKTILLQ